MLEKTLGRVTLSWDYIIDDDNLWLCSTEDNAIFKIRMEDFVCEDVFFFPEKPEANMCLAFDKVGDYIFFAPYNMQRYWKMNALSGEFSNVDLCGDDNNTNYMHIAIQERIGDKLVLVGDNPNRIFVYDIETGNNEIIDDYNMSIKKANIVPYIFVEPLVDGNSLFVPLGDYGYVLEFVLPERKFKLHNISNVHSGITAIAKYDSRYIIADGDGNTYIWDCAGDVEKFNDYKNVTIPIKSIIKLSQDEFLFISRLYRTWNTVNRKGLVAEYDIGKRDVNRIEGKWQQYMFAGKTEGCIFSQSCSRGEIYIFDCDSRLIVKKEITAVDDVFAKMYVKAISHCPIMRENDDCDLWYYINGLTTMT